jgi:hypothetical protein
MQVDTASITATLVGNWNTAYGWGDHSGLYQPVDADLTAIAALTATGGWAKRTAANTWSIATPTAADVGADAAGTAASAVSTHTSTYIHVAAPTADNQILQATGVGTAAWTTDIQALTSLVVDNITLDGKVATIGQFKIGEIANNRLRFECNRTDGAGGQWDFYPRPGDTADGTDSNLFNIWADTSVNYEMLRFGFSTSGYYQFTGESGGTGSLYPINITASSGSYQLWLHINGQASIGSNAAEANTILDVTGKYANNKYGNQLHLHTASNTYGMFAGSWNAEFGHITQGGYIATSATTIMPRTDTVCGVGFNNGSIDFYTNSGLTPGTAYSYTTVMSVTSSGVTINGDLIVNGINVTESITVDGGEVPHITGGNKDIYVATTGNDTTGTGLVGAPYLTVGRAILEVFKLVPSGDDATAEYTITIHVAAGHYAVASALFPTYAYGASLFVEGEIQDCDASTATSYSADTALVAGLSYIDVTGTLAVGTTAAIGDYLVVKVATGGTNPHLVEGCHEITAWNSGTRVYTAKVIRRDGVAALPAGTITLTDAYVSKTVLTFASGSGIKVQGSYFGGTWNKMTLVGNDSGNGIWCLNNGGIGLGAYLSTSHWGNNLYSQNNALIYADYSAHSYALSNLVRAQNGAVVNVRLGCNLTGAKTYGIYCFIGSSVAASTARMSTTGGTACIECESGSFVDASYSIIKDPHADAEYGNATMGGGINLTGATVSGGQTATADDDSFITGP